MSIEEAMRVLQERRQSQAAETQSVTPPIEDIGAEESDEPIQEDVEQPEEPEEGELEAAEESLEDDQIDPVYVIDGEEYTPDEIKEWKESGLRQRDYTQKTMALAEQRKAYDQAKDKVDKMDQIYQQQISQLDGMFQQDLQRFANADWARIARENPTEYQALKAEYDMSSARYNQFTQSVQQHMQQLEEEKKRLNHETAVACANTLRSRIKGFNREKYQDIVGYMVQQGMQEKDALDIVDPAVILLANKAMAYDRARKIGGKKKAGQPRAMKTSRRAQQGGEMEVQNLAKHARKTGKMEDALALYRARHKVQRQ